MECAVPIYRIERDASVHGLALDAEREAAAKNILADQRLHFVRGYVVVERAERRLIISGYMSVFRGVDGVTMSSPDMILPRSSSIAVAAVLRVLIKMNL